MLLAAAIFACSIARVVDGDTFRCDDGTSIRLAAVDSPELHGCHGRPGRICAPGDGQASKRALERLALGKTVRCERTGRSYERITAWCSVNGVDLSCAMYRGGFAIRAPEYDRGGRLLRCDGLTKFD